MQYEVCLSYTVSARTAAEAKKMAVGHITVKERQVGLSSPVDVFERMKKERRSAKEHFVVFHLNTQNEVVKKEVVSVGTLNASVVHPRELFRSAVLGRCASVIIAHNHPSGSLEPSEEDLAVTRRIKAAGEVLGIELLDHIIVTASSYKSFKSEKLI
jgi:DNA repair protein RadC